MVALGETITIVNKSGKVVSSSKHIVNVFKEARSAYRERKAEIRAYRDADAKEKEARHALKTLKLDGEDNRSTASRGSKAHRSKSVHHSHNRPPVERGYSDSFYVNDRQGGRRSSHPVDGSRCPPGQDFPDGDIQRAELTRRHTTGDGLVPVRPSLSRRTSNASSIDMDLAYGDLPPPLPARTIPDEVELRNKMSALTVLMDEANCLQHSVTAIIENLQKNPDALAAVALTLAEISNIASKLAPGALMSLKGAFPAVVGLLASPQFMIAAGVGVGVTVVALGGYKIIKKIQEHTANKALEAPIAMGGRALGPGAGEGSQVDELQEFDIGSDISRIEMWRRGIADVEAESQGTSVDGEFITPSASRQLVERGVLTEEDVRSMRTGRSRRGQRRKSESDRGSEAGRSERSKSGKTHRSSRTEKSERSRKEKDGKEKEKKKEPSGLRMLFKKDK